MESLQFPESQAGKEKPFHNSVTNSGRLLAKKINCNNFKNFDKELNVQFVIQSKLRYIYFHFN